MGKTADGVLVGKKLMQEIECLQFLHSQRMALPIRQSVVAFGFVEVLFCSPTVLVKLAYAVVGVGQSAPLVELECSFQVFRIALASLAQDVGKIAHRQVVAVADGPLIPIDRLMDVLLYHYSILKDAAEIVLNIFVLKIGVVGVVLQQVEQPLQIFFVETGILVVVGIRQVELTITFRDIRVIVLFICHFNFSSI